MSNYVGGILIGTMLYLLYVIFNDTGNCKAYLYIFFMAERKVLYIIIAVAVERPVRGI